MTRVILIGGGETIETIYYLAKHFSGQGYRVTIVNPYPKEARTLSQRVEATVILGDGSDPAVLEEAGARQADVVLSLTPYDPDNLIACQIAQKRFNVPRTIALVNDPDNEEIFRLLGIDLIFSATRIIGTMIEGQTIFEDIASLHAFSEGRVILNEVILRNTAPALNKTLEQLKLPNDSLVATILRQGQLIIPGGKNRLLAEDRIIVITRPENQAEVLRILTGDKG